MFQEWKNEINSLSEKVQGLKSQEEEVQSVDRAITNYV